MDSATLKSYLSAHNKDDLITLLLRVYEKGEEKIRNRILRGVVPVAERPKKAEPTVPEAQEYLRRVHTFCDNAMEGNYSGPSREVSKKERSQWRSTFADLRDTALKFLRVNQPKVAADALEALLGVLSYASGRYVFISPEPVDASRTDPAMWCRTFFQAGLAADDNDYDAFFSHILRPIYRWHFESNRYSEENPYAVLLEFCATPALKERLFTALPLWACERLRPELTLSASLYDITVVYEDDDFHGDRGSCNVYVRTKDGKKKTHERGFYGCTGKKWFKQELTAKEQVQLSELCEFVATVRFPWFFKNILPILEAALLWHVQQGTEREAERLLDALEPGLQVAERMLARALLHKAAGRAEEARRIVRKVLEERSDWKVHSYAKDVLERTA